MNWSSFGKTIFFQSDIVLNVNDLVMTLFLPFQTPHKYRCYSPTAMVQAIIKVKECGSAIKTAARQFGIPEASLRHKLSGRVDLEATRSGPPPMLSQEEEAHFVSHLKLAWARETDTIQCPSDGTVVSCLAGQS